jgi:hypothetical protein
MSKITVPQVGDLVAIYKAKLDKKILGVITTDYFGTNTLGVQGFCHYENGIFRNLNVFKERCKEKGFSERFSVLIPEFLPHIQYVPDDINFFEWKNRNNRYHYRLIELHYHKWRKYFLDGIPLSVNYAHFINAENQWYHVAITLSARKYLTMLITAAILTNPGFIRDNFSEETLISIYAMLSPIE